MSYKQFIPDIGSEWNDYWKKTSLETELKLVESDGLQSIFKEHLPKTGKILDAGCGMGKWIIHLSKRGYNIQGVDNNIYALSELRKYHPEAKVEPGDVTKLPFHDGGFSAYISLGVIEHFKDGPQKALKEAYRILRKHGIAIVEVPYDSPLRVVSRFFSEAMHIIKSPIRIFLEMFGLRRKRARINTKFYEYRYTRDELKGFMESAGFKNIKIFPKEDTTNDKSIALWLDYPSLQKKNGEIFDLNFLGIWCKKILNAISPFSYCALIVAVAKK